MVDEVLTMTFPMFRDSKVNNYGEMFSKPPQSRIDQHVSGASRQSETFWTSKLVRSWLAMKRGQDQQYDHYHKQGREEEDDLRESIKQKYAEILKLKHERRFNKIDEIKMQI